MDSAVIDLGDVVARFCAKWPGEFQGGTIGWGQFWLLYERLHVVLAVERVTLTRAVGLGMGGEAAGSMAQADIQEAFGHG